MLPALALLSGLLAWATFDLPRFGDYRGPYGFVLDRFAVPERHTTNVVTATVFDVRGFDTMGEEFILFAAVAGVALLLRRQHRAPRGSRDESIGSDAVRIFGTLGVAVGVLVGLWLVAFGFVTPGGGFQGGVAVASSMLLVYLVSTYRAWQRVGVPAVLEPLEGVGAGGYVVVGLAAVVSSLPFLATLLGPGTTGTLLSGGSAPFVNWAVALEVAAANLVLFAEFLEEQP